MTAVALSVRSPERRWTEPLALGLLVIVAVALTLTTAPVPVRTLATLTVTLVAGHCATTLVLGRRRPRPDGSEALPRAALPVVFAGLALLAGMLLTAAVGKDISIPNVAAALAALTVVLLAACTVAVPHDTTPVPGSGPRRVLRAAAGLTAAVTVLALGVVGAIAVQPVVPERYPVITVDDPLVRTGTPLTSRPHEPVRVDVTLSAHGVQLDSDPPPLRVQVGDTAVEATVSEPLPTSAAPLTGETDRQRRAVTFTAPDGPGLYPVEITAPAAPGDEPVALVLILQVGQ